MKKVLLFLPLMGGLLACEEETPVPVGSLKSPTGLALVQRPGTQRSDVLVVDSDAQGVLVLQLCRGSTVSAVEPADSPCNRPDSSGNPQELASFVPAPVVFFPLVIPAGAYPTRVAASPTGDRAYALSPGSNSLHLLDIREVDYFATATADSNRELGQLDLSTVAPSAVPVDVAVLSAAGADDRVLVSFAGLDGAPSVLAAFTVGGSGQLTARDVKTTPVAAGPGTVLVRPEAVYVSSRQSSEVSVVPRQGATLADRAVRVEVGGPSGDLVDAGEHGVLALRLDRPAVTLVESSSTGFARSKLIIASPYAAAEGPEPGTIDLRPVPVVTGAYGRVPGLWDSSGTEVVPLSRREDLGPDGKVGVAGLTHTDGLVSFLLGRPLRLATGEVGVGEVPGTTVFSSSVSVTRVRQLAGSSMSLSRCAPAVPRDCQGVREVEAPACTDMVRRAFPSPQDLRVSFQGALAGSPAGRLARSLDGRFTLLDGLVDSFVRRQIQPGDQVLLTVDLPAICEGSSMSRDLVETATVTGVDPLGLVVELAVAATATLALAWPCPADQYLPLAYYELYATGDELVLTEMDGNIVMDVLERVPLVRASSTATSASARLSARVDVRVQAGRGFTCTATRTVSPPCLFDSDCPSGSCLAESDCPGVCEERCADASTPGCVQLIASRLCSAIQFRVGAEVASTLDIAGIIRQRDSRSNLTLSAPADMLFVPLRNGFITSYPGSRLLAEGRVEAASGFDFGLFR